MVGMLPPPDARGPGMAPDSGMLEHAATNSSGNSRTSAVLGRMLRIAYRGGKPTSSSTGSFAG
jgi:hypothetical protein